MKLDTLISYLLSQEALGLLTRIMRLKPFSISVPAASAAHISSRALASIDALIKRDCARIMNLVMKYHHWLHSQEGRNAPPEERQRRFTTLRLQFCSITSQFDIFNDVISQRAEYETGIWTSGLDAVAADSLKLSDEQFNSRLPSVVCYLDRGFGAAIRRIKTRLPGGDLNPVAIIRIPRERMIGSSIASSLVHEVGHQGAALLDLVSSLKLEIHKRLQSDKREAYIWELWYRWISEIIADCWSVAKVGVVSTMGLMSVVSLPKPFVFALVPQDPHPIPWLRVKISSALGNAFYPDSQWNTLNEMWEQLYPPTKVNSDIFSLIKRLEQAIPKLRDLILFHRPPSLHGKTIAEAFRNQEIFPSKLRRLWNEVSYNPGFFKSVRPTVALSLIGQAKADGKIMPEREGNMVSTLLTSWAIGSLLEPYESAKKLTAFPKLNVEYR